MASKFIYRVCCNRLLDAISVGYRMALRLAPAMSRCSNSTMARWAWPALVAYIIQLNNVAMMSLSSCSFRPADTGVWASRQPVPKTACKSQCAGLATTCLMRGSNLSLSCARASTLCRCYRKHRLFQRSPM